MSEYYVPIFEFEGDAFNGSLVTAIEYEDENVRIHLLEREDPLEYTFDDDDEAEEKCAEAIAAWKRATGAHT